MWRNYMTVGFRALAKNKTNAFINIFGLALGLAACLMILLYVRYETSYDKWLPNSENIYQLQTYYRDAQTGEEVKLQMASYISGTAVKKDFPQVERMVYVQPTRFTVLRNGEAFGVEEGSQVDGRFFDVLPFPLVRGDPRTALANAGSVALSETEARRLFGDRNPIGQTLTVIIRGKAGDHPVTAVFRDLPRNSHMRFDMVVRYDPVTFYAEQPGFLTDWGRQNGWFYLALRPGTDVRAIQAAMPAWEKRNIGDEKFGDKVYNAGDEQDYKLVNISDVHLGQAQDGAAARGNDMRTIATFGIIAALILGMACVNFTNLATARACQRAREVALRKVLGASRTQLVVQFLGESILVAALAMLVALAMVELLLPSFSHFLDADLGLAYWGKDGLLLPILGLVLLVGTVGGIYPAFYLSRFQPAQVLKANNSAAEPGGTGRLRNALVVTQFAVSIGLTICTATVYAQTVFARTSDPGYKREGLLQVDGISRGQVAPLAGTMVRQIEQVDGVVSAGRTNIGIATPNSSSAGVQVPGLAEPVTIGTYSIDHNFLQTMGVRLIAGRLFEESRPLDDATTPSPEAPEAERALVARGINIVVNQLAAKQMGFRSPAEAVGKEVRISHDEAYGGILPATIIGVVQDSRFRSIRDPIDPILFKIDTNNLDEILVRYDGADPQRVRADIERIWKRLVPDAPFSADFSEDIIQKLYGGEEARAEIFAIFSLLAALVASLGLFGLASFTTERRTKEIGIRKVLGARIRDIVRLLAWQFSKPVILANLIAWPVAWWAMRDWLNTFDARIPLGPGPFVLAGLIALGIAIGTVAGHAFRVARLNPIHALRYE